MELGRCATGIKGRSPPSPTRLLTWRPRRRLSLAGEPLGAEVAAPDWLSQLCGVATVPTPGSLVGGFMGPLRWANTTSSTFAYYR